jgi:hypothetical protein
VGVYGFMSIVLGESREWIRHDKGVKERLILVLGCLTVDVANEGQDILKTIEHRSVSASCEQAWRSGRQSPVATERRKRSVHLLPPAHSCGAFSTISTLRAPPSFAAMAAEKPALPDLRNCCSKKPRKLRSERCYAAGRTGIRRTLNLPYDDHVPGVVT